MRLRIILRSWIIHPNFKEGLSYAYTSERYAYVYETIINIAITFEENGQWVSKYRSSVHSPILQDEHIQWLVERLDANLVDITVESFHHQLNEAFQFPHLVSIIFVSKAIKKQAKFTLKLMRYKLNNYKNEEYVRGCIERCQKFLELNGSMVDVVYVDKVGFNLHLTLQFKKACWGQRCQWIHPTQKNQNLSLVVIVGCEGVVAHNVTLGAYTTKKLLEFL